MPSKHIMSELREMRNLLMQGNEEFLRRALTKMLNLMMELEVEINANATKHERSGERESYYPSFLESQ